MVQLQARFMSEPDNDDGGSDSDSDDEEDEGKDLSKVC